VPKQKQNTHRKAERQGGDPYPYRPVPVLPGQLPLVPDLEPLPQPDIQPDESPPEVTAPDDEEPPAVQPTLF
jgi:hypothetical protein